MSTLRPEWQVELGPGSVDEAAEWFNTHAAPDLLFLDIHLSDGDAFDFLQTVRPPCAVVVFTTAYDQYALRAFSVNSIDYILKPFDEKRRHSDYGSIIDASGLIWLKIHTNAPHSATS